jgi:hypothetical protein
MRRLAVLTGALILSAVLSGCGSSAFSYSEGFHVGQSLAANVPRSSLVGSHAAAVCRRDWLVAGSVSMGRLPWLRGCIVGFDMVARVVGQP